MPGIPVRLVLSISRILSESDGIPHVMLLVWLQTHWLEVILTTVIPVKKSLLYLIFTAFSFVQKTHDRIAANSTNYSHVSPVRKTHHWFTVKHFICFQDSPTGVQIHTNWLC